MSPRFTRRDFLKTVVVTAGAVQLGAVIPGCSSDDHGSGPSDLTFPQSVCSGDPRADSIVLWTRAGTAATGDVALSLEVATDQAFSQLVTLSQSSFITSAASDRCLRIKVTGLLAGTRYYYRFRSGSKMTPTGRFKTASTAASDTPVKIAFLSCQDYVGRYYNTLVDLLDASNDDIDVVVHLGDYIYETTGDPSFQATTGRKVTFSDTAGAIAFGTGANTYYAAKSVSNYRDLYKTYRSDPTLQKVHEKFPFIVIWDDHEYTNDCWGDVATYYGGLKDEADPERRRNAEQAFFEFQPIALDAETGEGALTLTRDQLWPNIKLYRDFRFGKHAHLIMTDYRSFRPDNPVPEDAFPGKIVMDEATLKATLAAVGGDPTQLEPFPQYVNLDDADYATQKSTAVAVLTAAYAAAGADNAKAATMAAAAASGNVDVSILNEYLASYPELVVDTKVNPNLPHGISYASIGKPQLFGQLGSRYLLVKPTYDLYTAYLQGTAPQSLDPYGSVQSAWITERLAAEADATWTVYGDSVSLASLVVDLSAFASFNLPIPATQYYLNCDQWDGFPPRRKQLFEQLYAKNAVIISGDIHGAYFTDYGPDASGNRLIEFTGPAVSSSTFAEELQSTANSAPGLSGHPLVGTLINSVDGLVKSASGDIPGTTNKHLALANSFVNGVVILTLDGTTVTGRYALLPSSHVTTDMTGTPDAVRAAFVRWTVTATKTDGKTGAPTTQTS